MSHEICELELGHTYVANINVIIAASGRHRLVLEDASPDSFLIEDGAEGDGRFVINADPGQPCPYREVEFVFTVGEGYAFAAGGFRVGVEAKNSGWRFGPAKISGSQCSVTAQISAGAGRLRDYLLFCRAVAPQSPAIIEVGPRVSVGAAHDVAVRNAKGRPPAQGSGGDKHPPVEATGLEDPVEATGLEDPVEATGLEEPVEATGLEDPLEATGLEDPVEATGLEDPLEATGLDEHHHRPPV